MNQSTQAGKREQKSERARATICKATVSCLAELGYAETSINRVVERAGVSKGALQHHFPSKEDLMASAADYLLAKPLHYADQAKRQPDRDLRARFLRIWDTLTNTSSYLALLEILIASRTDRVLHRRIAGELASSIHDIDDHFLTLYDTENTESRTELRELMCANRCFMRGLLIEEQYGLSKTQQREVLERWLNLIVPRFEALNAQPAING